VKVEGETLVVVGRVFARGKESGLGLDSGWSAALGYRDGLILNAWDWLDRDAAFEAVGASGEP
jgi:ketosteroid isomerase-like protein